MRWSISSPPRWVSPLVDFTSITPSLISRIEISNVPPPKSNTAMVPFFFLSNHRQSCSGWFVDDTFYIKSGNFSCIFCCLALRIIKIGRNGDNRFGNCFAQIILLLFALIQLRYCSCNFLWGIFFALCDNANITICSFDYFIGHVFDFISYFIIFMPIKRFAE